MAKIIGIDTRTVLNLRRQALARRKRGDNGLPKSMPNIAGRTEKVDSIPVVPQGMTLDEQGYHIARAYVATCGLLAGGAITSKPRLSKATNAG